MSIVLQVVFAFIGFGILVFFHELGHFIVALFFKIKVETFSIGMGPGLLKYKKGDTVYQIGAVPFGGFCKFKGDELTDNQDISRDPDSFYGAKPWKRLIVAFCGPFMNYLIALLFLAFLAMGSFSQDYLPNKVVLSEDSLGNDVDAPLKSEDIGPAYKAGLRTGDKIILVGKKKVETFDELSRYLVVNRNKEVAVTVERGTENLSFMIKPKWSPEAMRYIIGVSPYIEPVIDRDPQDDKTLTAQLDLQSGDRIVAINDIQEDWNAVSINRVLSDNFSKNIISKMSIIRQGETFEYEIDVNQINSEVDVDNIFLTFQYPNHLVKGENPISAVISGLKESNMIIRLSFFGLYDMIFMPKKNVQKQLGGPIRIGHLIGKITVAGFKDGLYAGLRNFLSIVSYISLALAFFNLLPIPAVDGGHIMLNMYEIIVRKPISLKILYRINFFGFIFIILFAIVITMLDIFNIVSGG